MGPRRAAPCKPKSSVAGSMMEGGMPLRPPKGPDPLSHRIVIRSGVGSGCVHDVQEGRRAAQVAEKHAA